MKQTFLFICVLSTLTTPALAENIRYNSIPEGQSPFQNDPSPQVDATNQQHQADMHNNSGLYSNNTPKAYSPPSGGNAPSGIGSSSPPQASSESMSPPSKTHWDSTGHEIDTESGLATGNYDPSKARSTASAPEGDTSTGTEQGTSPSTDSTQNEASTGSKDSVAENSPTGYDTNPETVRNAVNTIAGVVQNAPGQNAKFFAPGLAQLQAGEKAYTSSHKSCVQGQANASTWCRDETNPELQKTLMIMNAATAAMNSIAVKDACSTFSKVMSMAQLGMTAYTLSCGAMKKKCDVSCGKAAKGLESLQTGISREYSCLPIDPTMPSGCPDLLASYKKATTNIQTALKKELASEDRKAIAGKVKLCSQTYTGLLASAGLSLVSIANSIKQGQKCDDDSNGSGNGGGSPPTETAGSTISNDSETTTTSNTETETETTNTQTNNVQSTVVSDTSNTPIFARHSGDATRQEKSAYAAYLPGGEKDPQRTVAGESTWRKEVTSAGGKSNWQKTRDRYKDFDALP